MTTARREPRENAQSSITLLMKKRRRGEHSKAGPRSGISHGILRSLGNHPLGIRKKSLEPTLANLLRFARFHDGIFRTKPDIIARDTLRRRDGGRKKSQEPSLVFDRFYVKILPIRA